MGRTPYLNWLGHESEADKEAARLALEHTCLDIFADRQIAKVSGGEQQRVLLARPGTIDTGVTAGRAHESPRPAAPDESVVAGQRPSEEKGPRGAHGVA